jgi:DNA-binding NarL/FixJ family response regulator
MLWLLKESDNEVIANHLSSSAATVLTHRKHIFSKLQVHDLGSARSKILKCAEELRNNRQVG